MDRSLANRFEFGKGSPSEVMVPYKVLPLVDLRVSSRILENDEGFDDLFKTLLDHIQTHRIYGKEGRMVR